MCERGVTTTQCSGRKRRATKKILLRRILRRAGLERGVVEQPIVVNLFMLQVNFVEKVLLLLGAQAFLLNRFFLKKAKKKADT